MKLDVFVLPFTLVTINRVTELEKGVWMVIGLLNRLVNEYRISGFVVTVLSF